MESKNIIAAISLSAAVIILYTLFFQPDPRTVKQNLENKKKIQTNTDTPALDQVETFSEITREEALIKDERVQFENDSVIGTISLKGAIIDDLTFKEYNVKLNSNEKVTLLNPRNVKDGYLIESGFVTNNKNIDVPDSSTTWKIVGNKKLKATATKAAQKNLIQQEAT